MKKYKNFNVISGKDIASFRGLEKEISFSPYAETEILPLRISRFGITNPDQRYYIERLPSPCFILEYIVSGVGYLTVGGEKYKLTAGDAYLIHPGDFCEYYADGDDPYKKYWINFSAELFFNEMLKAYGITDRVFHGVDLSQSFEKLFSLENVSAFNDDLYIPASKIIFGMIMDIALKKKDGSESAGRDIAAAVRYILSKSVASPISISDVASKVFRSENDVIRQFRKRYGITPYSYLLELRIKMAKNLLGNTDKTLAEIAAHLCFSSEYHFSNTFKKKVGISPKEYRRMQA